MKRDIPTTVTEARAQFSDHFRGLSNPPAVPVAVATAVLALWTLLYRGVTPAVEAASAPGGLEAMGTHGGVAGLLAYLLAWGLLASAATYPALVPFLGRYLGSVRGPETRTWRVAAALLGAYSLVWTATGVVPLAVDAMVDVSALADRSRAFAVGTTAILAGLYQLTPAKRDALEPCSRAALGRDPSVSEAARRGVERARRCVRCTWPLFALLVVVGSLNPVWLLAVTAVVTLERFAPRGDEVAATVGAVAILGGATLVTAGVVGA
jgi:predicted metal-binding membrane protein